MPPELPTRDRRRLRPRQAAEAQLLQCQIRRSRLPSLLLHRLQPRQQCHPLRSRLNRQQPPARSAEAASIPQSDGMGALISLLEKLRNAPPATDIRPGMTPLEQMAALQASTAMQLLHAGTNMLLMQSGMFAAAAAMPMAVSVPGVSQPGGCPTCFPTEEELAAGSVTSPKAGSETAPRLVATTPKPSKSLSPEIDSASAYLCRHHCAQVGYGGARQGERCGAHGNSRRQRHPYFGGNHRRR